MKKIPVFSNKRILLLLFLAILLAGMLAGGAFIRALFINYKLQEYSDTITLSITAAEKGEEITIHGKNMVFLYDASGACTNVYGISASENTSKTSQTTGGSTPETTDSTQQKSNQTQGNTDGTQEHTDTAQSNADNPQKTAGAKQESADTLQESTDTVQEGTDTTQELLEYQTVLNRLVSTTLQRGSLQKLCRSGENDFLVYGQKLSGEQTEVFFFVMPEREMRITLNSFRIVFALCFAGAALMLIFWFAQYEKTNKKLNQVRSRAFANISHEFKTPITSIKALTETLADGMVTSDETRQHYYELILSETARLESFVTNSLQLSRIQNTHQPVQMENISVLSLLSPLADKYRLLCERKQISFSFLPSDTQGKLLRTEPQLARQAVDIFLHNALKFTASGGITLRVVPQKNHVRIQVEDTGSGISKEDAPHIFERFYMVDTESNPGGSGLGLSIAKEISDRLHENISFDSKARSGSTFTLTIHYSKENTN